MITIESPVPKCTELPNSDKIHNILGEFKKPDNVGISLHDEIQQRWEVFLKEGVSKEEVAALRGLYPQPTNINCILGPELNPEIREILSQQINKNDNFIQRIQDEVGLALCALSGPLHLFVETDSSASEHVVKVLADSAKILCNVQHKLSLHRRHSIVPNLDINVKDTIEKAPIGKFLFGEDLGTRCKNAKEMKKSGNELKRKMNFNQKSLNFRSLPAQKRQNVSWKAFYQNKPRNQFNSNHLKSKRWVEKKERAKQFRQQQRR